MSIDPDCRCSRGSRNKANHSRAHCIRARKNIRGTAAGRFKHKLQAPVPGAAMVEVTADQFTRSKLSSKKYVAAITPMPPSCTLRRPPPMSVMMLVVTAGAGGAGGIDLECLRHGKAGIDAA